jgi:hypothetical protein
MPLPSPSSLTSSDWLSIGSLAFAGLSVIFSIIALVVSSLSAYVDRINTNSWETYQAYNSDGVRAGRALAQKILKDTEGVGLPTHEAYDHYFGLDIKAAQPPLPGLPSEPVAADSPLAQLQESRQHLHDLAAFYHQTGELLRRRRLDEGFTMALVGPGLHDRWKALEPIASYYPPSTSSKNANATDFPYGGMYLLYERYRRWEMRYGKGQHRAYAEARERLQRLLEDDAKARERLLEADAKARAEA